MSKKLLQKCIHSKTLALLLFFVCFSSYSQQYTAISDTSFEQSLINIGLDSGTIDGQVLTANIAGITELNIQGGSIKDLTGIKDFTSLQELYLSYQQIVSLDVSGMTNLRVVEIYANALTSINLSGLINLETLRCGSNDLTTLDLTGLTKLQLLGCGQNNFTSLNLAGLNSLVDLQCNENQITSLNLSALTNLTSLNCGSNQLTSLDLNGLTNLTSVSCYQNQLTTLNLNGLIGLSSLNCSTNNLTALNLSNKPLLENMWCDKNPMLSCITVDNIANADLYLNNESWGKETSASFSLSCAPKATSQSFCNGATVANLVATGSAIQWYLDSTGGSALASNTVLVSGNYYVSQTINSNESSRTTVAVTINTTPLPSRDMSVGGTLCRPSTYATLASKFNNPSAIKIYASETSTTPIDSSLEITPVGTFLTLYITQTINGCESARLVDSQTFVNPNYEPTAIDQTFCARTLPTVANLVATANGGGSDIKWYLTPITVNPLVSTRALTTRDYYVTQTAYPCGESPRKKVSVTIQDTEEINVYTCGSYTWPLNDVTYTESSNPSFDDGCVIHYLNLTIAPVDLPVINSQFRLNGSTIADITITQGQLVQWYEDATGGEPLASNTPLLNKTYYASQRQTFSDTNAQCESDRLAVDITVGTIPAGYTFIADPIFEQKLIDLGYDDVIDNKVLSVNIATITNLNLMATGIHDLTGIKGFKNLISLEIMYNSIYALDVSGMTTLESISAYGNYMTSVNLNGLSNLKTINLGNSNLTTLNLTGLTSLENLECSGNPITELDLSGMTNMTDLNCRYTKIAALNLTKTPNLINLICDQIPTLSCIMVNDIDSANTNTINNTWRKDPSATYSLGTTTVTTATTCESYTWSVNDKTYTSSGTYIYANGCDEQVLNLTIRPGTTEYTESHCGEYYWKGITYTESGTYTSVDGCHTDVLNLTITPSTANTTTISACDSYTWSVNGQTYSTSGNYTHVNGCTTENLALTIATFDVSVVLANGVLSSNTPNATYQWIDCSNNQPILGAISQIFTPALSGSYSVNITLGDCSVTSACISVTTLATDSFDLDTFKFYPNPVNDNLYLSYSKELTSAKIINTQGQVIFVKSLLDSNAQINMSKLPTGIYFVEVKSLDTYKTIKVIKK